MSENQLFVAEEDEDVVMKDSFTEKSLEDDPVVQEIPLNLSSAPFPLHLLQYPNKPKKAGREPNTPHVSQARYKMQSSLWELDIPLNTEVFYDKNRAEDEWASIAHQTLKGVGVKNEGQYAGLISDNEVYLLPVDMVAQMRPYFNYIDSISQMRREDDVRSANQSNTTAKKAQVVTMSVKSSSEANQPRLGGSLLAHKVADEEDELNLEWITNTFPQFKESVTSAEAREYLKPKGDENDYLSKLM
ncbi:LAFE_0B11188g1_1 [Lachancea fermentati]|uniref:LAFE_0B11188g1_1 n=1 Tax=Lachancea fermentati TaxID=4955 RepID=A0A1G4M8Z5_LACFM|nr:LAFE_0B11188g1_1 [Lachancea fermentati]